MSAASFTANLAAYLLQTTLLLSAGLLLPWLFGMRDPHVRLRYWYALLSFSLLVPFVWLAARPTAASSGSFTGRLAGGMEVQVHLGPAPLSPWVWVLVVLAAGAAARAIWLLGGLVLLERLRRRSRALPSVPQAFAEASTALSVHAEFRLSPSVRTPLTFGWVRPVVLLPEEVTGMSPEAQRCIALHELLHVRRRDWLAILLEESLRSLLWFHPALWLVLDRVALSREQSVDREVVRITEARRTYMSTLSAMARTRQGAAAMAILPFFHRSHLLQRLALLTQEVSMSKFRLGLAAAGSAFALLLAGAVAAGAFPLLVGGDQTHAAKLAVSGYSTDDILPMGSIKAPKLLNQVNPVYPEEARKKGLKGRVVLETVINKKGETTQLKVLMSDNEIFNASAMEAVSQWRYESPRRDGKPVNVRWIITINFIATK